MSINIQVKGLEELRGRFRTSPRIVAEQIQKAISQSVMLILRQTKLEAPAKKGILRSLIKSKISPFKGTVKSEAAYSIYVHEGTKAHIIRPVRKKALYWKGAEHPVKLVHHPGTRANPFMERGAKKSESKVQAIFQIAINNVTKKLAT